MKKIMTFLLAAAVIFCAAFMLKGGLAVSAKISPTAPTITDPSHVTVTVPPDKTTNNYTTPSGGIGTTGSGGTTSPGVTRVTGTTSPATKPTAGTTGRPTTPDGSTVTGPVQPDRNPESPKTGGASSSVFVFAGIAFAGAAVTVLAKKDKKDN